MIRLSCRVGVVILTAIATTHGAVLDLPIYFSNSYASVKVKIGTPPSTYHLFLDTGSSSIWIDDKSCGVSCLNNSGYNRVGYNATASSTSVDLHAHGSIDYFGGAIAGPGISDIFTLDTVNGASVAWSQTFLAANESSWPFITADGFLGLAFSTIAAPKTTTLVETLMQNGLLDDHRFGMYFGKHFDLTDSNPQSVLTIGGSKEAKYVDGNLTYISLEKEKFEVWRASVQSITGSKSSTSRTTRTQPVTNAHAVFDTGAGQIQVPSSIVAGLYDSIGFNYTAILEGDYIPMCSEFNSSWSVSFNFGEANSSVPATLTLTGDQLASPGFANNMSACFPPFDDSGGEGFFLLGTPLLYKFYTVWDFGAFAVSNYQPRVGFGTLKPEFRG